MSSGRQLLKFHRKAPDAGGLPDRKAPLKTCWLSRAPISPATEDLSQRSHQPSLLSLRARRVGSALRSLGLRL